jgi:hypothetical protein
MDEQQFAQQQQNQDAAMAMGRHSYMNQMQSDLNSLLTELTNYDNNILEVEMALKGMQMDKDGEWKQVTKPLLNDEGVFRMIELIKTMVSKCMIMSNLTEEQISKLSKELGRNICRELTTNKKKYDVQDNDRSTIVSIILYPSYESANSALENGLRRFLKSGIIETTINTQGNQQMKSGKGGGGFLSALGFGKR